jgi:hypothetical protein
MHMTPENWGAIALLLVAMTGLVLTAVAVSNAVHAKDISLQARTRVEALRPVLVQAQNKLHVLASEKEEISRGSVIVGGVPYPMTCAAFCSQRTNLQSVLKPEVLSLWRGATSRQQNPTADDNAFCMCVEDATFPFS